MEAEGTSCIVQKSLTFGCTEKTTDKLEMYHGEEQEGFLERNGEWEQDFELAFWVGWIDSETMNVYYFLQPDLAY